MDNKTNKRIAVSYKLYVDGDKGEREMVEEATADRPFELISGFGYALDAFEEKVTATAEGDNFSLMLPKEQAYGDYHPEYIIDLERDMFVIDGKFDSEHVFTGAVIPLQNEEGHRFNGRVIEIGTDKVKVDLNHPLAGKTLYFEGTVLENCEATKAEIDHLIKHLTGGCEGCGGGGCGDCGGCGGCQ